MRRADIYEERTLRLKPGYRAIIIQNASKVEDYYWTQVQSNFIYNNAGRFLFTTFDYDELIEKIEETITEDARIGDNFRQYTINRWYNYLTSLVIQDFFASHPRVRVEKDPRSLYRDFFIDGIPFDLKVTFAPKGWSLDKVRGGMKDPRSLIRWMYRGGGADRQHWDPKIFIVLLDLDRVGEHAWEMKRSLDEIEKLVNQYLENTRETDFYRGFTVTRRKTKYPVEAADLMFLVKDAGRYEGIFYVWKDNKPLPRSVDL